MTMMRLLRISLLMVALLTQGALAAPPEALADDNARFGEDRAIVVGNKALVFTASLLPVDTAGELLAPADARAQTGHVLQALEVVLDAARLGLENVLRLHVYVAEEADTEVVRGELAEAFATMREPALTLVQSAMPVPGALVMLDAVAEESSALRDRLRRGRLLEYRRAFLRVPDQFQFVEGLAHAGILKPGPLVIVSGRAAAGEDLSAAVQGTMKELQADLRSLDLNILHHAVSMKVFLNEMEAAGEVAREIAAFFEEARTQEPVLSPELPVLSFAEWRHERENVPVEIELIAHERQGVAKAGAPQVEYFDSNPRFSRIARVNRGELIFVSGLYGGAGGAEEQVRTHFSRLASLLEPLGSGLGHLIKATYYVSDPEISTQLGEQRPHIYPEGRAPAASLITVGSVARPGRSLATDMIAVVPD